MTQLTVARDGKIALPGGLRERHGFSPGTSVRVVEGRHGVLLVPLKEREMSPELAQELSAWQSLGTEAWGLFPYEDDGE